MDLDLMTQLKALTGEGDETLLGVLLSMAKEAVLKRLYPYKTGVKEVPERYAHTVLEIAVYLYNRRGSEGETSHDEGDTKRTYESAGIPESMLRGVVPFCGVLS